jgi:hypothetical protein
MKTLDDLQPWSRRLLDRAYETDKARRPKCSRDDFAAGFIACLEAIGSRSSFVEVTRCACGSPTCAAPEDPA